MGLIGNGRRGGIKQEEKGGGNYNAFIISSREVITRAKKEGGRGKMEEGRGGKEG